MVPTFSFHLGSLLRRTDDGDLFSLAEWKRNSHFFSNDLRILLSSPHPHHFSLIVTSKFSTHGIKLFSLNSPLPPSVVTRCWRRSARRDYIRLFCALFWIFASLETWVPPLVTTILTWHIAKLRMFRLRLNLDIEQQIKAWHGMAVL